MIRCLSEDNALCVPGSGSGGDGANPAGSQPKDARSLQRARIGGDGANPAGSRPKDDARSLQRAKQHDYEEINTFYAELAPLQNASKR